MNKWYENEISIGVMAAKYLHPEETTYLDLLKRVSGIFSPELGSKVYDLMLKGSFFPGGRSLYGAGSKGKFNATMSNCYIMKSPEDSLDSIYDTKKLMARIFKSGGGIGLDISKLRPANSRTNNAAKTSTGAVSFIHEFNVTGEIIGFYGRRGATLVGMRISHPDILDFVNLRENYELKAMNISCLITKDFMDAVKNDSVYTLHFDVGATGEQIKKEVNAKELYRRICQMNWDYGDPGMLFMDTIRNHNLQSENKNFDIEICNPCAEYTGPAFNSCNLGSLNLYNYVHNKFKSTSIFDEENFKKDIHTAVECLDEILDYGYDLQPLEQNKKIVTDWRSIGLGFFGLADMFIAMGVKYGSEESIEIAAHICRTLLEQSIYASSKLAKEKGTFRKYNKTTTLKSPIMIRLKEENPEVYEHVEKYGIRHAQLLSIAPTGSLSLLANCGSSGIEPIFKTSYKRTSHGLEDKKIGFTIQSRSIVDLLNHHKKSHDLSSEEIKAAFPFVIETQDIDPVDRVKIQAAMQQYVDNAISSTITLKEEATVEDIEKIYMLSYELGLKGITVFRNNCKRASILGFDEKSKEKTDVEKIVETKLNSIDPISRKTKNVLHGSTYKKSTACVKSLYITVNRDEDNNLFEVFTNKSTHGCSANIATITRLSSLALRSGIKVDKIIEELKSNSCQACVSLNNANSDNLLSSSCSIAIAEAIESEYNRLSNYEELPKIKPIKKVVEVKEKKETSALACPKCYEKTLIPEGKCVTCIKCGYSKC